jgi:hypothetical protein
MANLLYNYYKSSKIYYHYNLLLTLTTYIYSVMLTYSVNIIPNKYLVSVQLDVMPYYSIFTYILDEYYKLMICQNKGLYIYKSFSFKSFTSC